MNFEIHHTALIMNNREEALEFFVNKLGMELLRESYSERRQGNKLEIGYKGKYIFEVFTIPGIQIQGSPEVMTGHNHVAFGVDDVAATLDELKARGVEVSEAKFDSLAEKYYGFFYGPCQVKFELYEH